MNTKNKFKLIQDSALEGVAELHVRSLATASKVGGMSQRAKTSLSASIFLGLLAFNSAAAYAAGDCGEDAGSKLAGFIGKLASFLMLLGGALALLMFAVGALYIIAGSKQSNVSKGIGFIKNAALGVGVLILGGFIKVIIVTLASGAVPDGQTDTECVKKADDGFK